MFIFSFRLSAKRALIALAALILVVGLGYVGVQTVRGKDEMASAAVGKDRNPAGKGKKQKIKVKNNEERLAFIQGYGWEVTPEPSEVVEVIIPQEFDAVYTDYNALQKLQGFDLESYAGKRCKRYAYNVLNYPETDGEVQISLLLHGDRLIGGDVHSTSYDGFLHGFELSQQ